MVPKMSNFFEVFLKSIQELNLYISWHLQLVTVFKVSCLLLFLLLFMLAPKISIFSEVIHMSIQDLNLYISLHLQLVTVFNVSCPLSSLRSGKEVVRQSLRARSHNYLKVSIYSLISLFRTSLFVFNILIFQPSML